MAITGPQEVAARQRDKTDLRLRICNLPGPDGNILSNRILTRKWSERLPVRRPVPRVLHPRFWQRRPDRGLKRSNSAGDLDQIEKG
jgi:hypothetical protein